MWLPRNKQSIPNFVCSVLFLAFFIFIVTIGVIGETENLPLYIAICCVFGLVFLFSIHKGNFIKLKESEIVFRKYFLFHKVKYADIPVLFITKYVTSLPGGPQERHEKDGKLSGYMFFMKDITLSAKDSLRDCMKMEGEWSIIYIDARYRKEILERVLSGGFQGKIYITAEMRQVWGEEIEGEIEKAGFNNEFITVETETSPQA